MFIIDALGNVERTSIYLSRPSSEPLVCLDEFINEETANMVRGLNQQQELTFEVNRQDNDWYEYIQEGMYLYVDGVGFFKMKQPQIEFDGTKEIKKVEAYSCDGELEDKNLNIEINMGTKTSQEYLVVYSSGEGYDDTGEQVINPYTGIPYDWITLYNTFPEQLTAHLADYDRGYFGGTSGEITVTEKVKVDILNNFLTMIPRLKSKFIETEDEETGVIDYELVEYADITYNQYDGRIQSITLHDGYRSRLVYLIGFYTRYRDQLSLLSLVLEKTNGAWTVGDVFGVSDGDYTLANKKYQFEINENIYSFLATTLAQTTNCMLTFDIFNRKVNMTPVENIGEDTGIHISYDNLLNKLDIQASEDNLTTRLTMKGSDDLSIEQVNFGLDYIEDLSYKINATDSNGKRVYVSNALAQKYTNYVNYREGLRAEYVQLSKSYRKYMEQIDEIKYRVPLDDLKTDWGTFSMEELEASLTAYKNLLASLITIYRDEYYPQGINADDSVNENFMKTTVYWYDYDAYKNIITEIECAISTFPYYSDHVKWSDYDKTRYEDAIKAWETEWTLYGTKELEAKIEAYKYNMDTLAESAVIRTAPDADTIKTWNQLTDAEKTSFGNSSANYQYDAYMDNYDNMLDAKTYLATLQAQIDSLVSAQTSAQTRRNQIVQLVTLENNFTADECKILSTLYRDADCSNDNILITSLDSADEKIDRMYELLEYGQEQLSIMSRPQLEFTIDSDNLLALGDYESLWKDFKVGNFILVQYRDDTFIKLRMIGYEYNPCLPSSSDFKITFSNSVRSKVGVTDLENILGLSSTSTSSGGGSGSSSGSGDNYGESDDIDITISNTMLAKLLNSELFGTRVKNVILDTINANTITARYATFNGLANGTTTIDGQCITTGWIVSLDYNGTTSGAIDNTTGSILNLNTGYFNFGGGKVKYNGDSLTVDGNIVAQTLSTGGRTGSGTGHNGLFIDSSGNLYSGSSNGVIIYSNGQFNFGNGDITYDGSTTTIATDVVIGGKTPTEIFDDIETAQETADGKTKIYYGTTSTITPPDYDLKEGDYLVDSNTGSTYRWSVGSSSWIIATDYATAIEDAVEELEEEIIIQIDGKIETWAQDSNPANQWLSADLHHHDKDLWYYTGTENLTIGTAPNTVTIEPSKTYQYNYNASTQTGTWSEYHSPNTSLFDFADGKSTIYSGTYPFSTVTDAKEHDFAVNTSDKKIYQYDGTTWNEVNNYSAAISDLQATLEEQIDAKVETWAQSANPALSWSASDLETHNGDLWLYTGLSDLVINGVTIHPQGTYKLVYSSSTEILDETGANITDESGNNLSMENNYVWQSYSMPNNNLFDLTDGKSTIYYGTPSGSYSGVQDGDYLVDNTTGTTYRYGSSGWTPVTSTGTLCGTSSSSASSAEKIVACSETITAYEGLVMSVTFQNENVAYSTPLKLNVTGLGVRSIYYDGKVISNTNRMYWSAGTTIMFMFDGVGWIVVGHPLSYHGVCSTSASTTAKSCSIDEAVIVKGTIVNLTFTDTNSATSPTLNVIDNTSNAPTITVDSSNNTLSATSQYNWNSGASVGFVFDGKYWKITDSSALYNTNSYMKFESAYGLMIANMTGGVTNISSVTTPNTLLTSNDLQIRNGQTVLAKFGSSVELAANGANITIGSTSSYNTYITSSSLLFRYNGNPLAEFSGSGITIGATNSYNTYFTSSGLSFRNNGTTIISITVNDYWYEFSMSQTRSPAEYQLSLQPDSITSSYDPNVGTRGDERYISVSGKDGIYYSEIISTSPVEHDDLFKVSSAGQCSAKSFHNFSDERFKKDMILLSNVHDEFLLSVKPISYKWKKEGQDYYTNFGFSAQSVARTMHDYGMNIDDYNIVNKYTKSIDDENEYTRYYINYIEFIPMIIHLCQRQQQEIDNLKLKISQLKI